MTNNRLYLWITLAMFFWGASWPIAGVLSTYIEEHEFITYRYVLTVITMVPVLWWMKLSFKIDLANFIIASLAAVLLIFYSKFYFLSTKYGSPGLAGAVVTTLMPILVYLLMLFSKQKKPQIKDWMALALGAVGVVVTMNIWHLGFEGLWVSHNIYMLAAAGFWALMSITSTYAKAINPASLSFYIYLITAIFDWIFFFEPIHGSIFAMDSIFWVNFLIVTIGSTTFATTVYFLGLQKLGSKQGSVFTFLVPFFAVGLSVVFLGEAWHWTTVLGAAMTIVALIILNKIKFSFYNKHS